MCGANCGIKQERGTAFFMLTHISITNYTIVSALELEFNRGMTVITGETGSMADAAPAVESAAAVSWA